MGWNGCDAAGEVLRVGDSVKVINDYYVDNSLPVGSVVHILKLEPLSYEGFSGRQVYVSTDRERYWLNHKWVLNI
jgi:hypothetical protein